MWQNDPLTEEKWKQHNDAIEYLEKQGFKLQKNWCWLLPKSNHKLNIAEEKAVIYLMEEWDYPSIKRDFIWTNTKYWILLLVAVIEIIVLYFNIKSNL